MKILCHYAIARFTPFIETGEFANVGVVLFAPDARFFGFRLLVNRHARVTNFFEQLDARVFKSAMRTFREELQRIDEMLKPLGTDRRFKSIDRAASFRLWEEVIKPRETILRFSEARVALATGAPKAKVEALYNYYVERNFVTREYEEKALDRSVRGWLKEANLLSAFMESRVGNEQYSAAFPFVTSNENGRPIAAIKPLNLDQASASRIIDHGGQWAVRVNALKKRSLLPDHVLFTVKGPDDDSSRGAAFVDVVGNLRELGVEVSSFDDRQAVIDFASPIVEHSVHPDTHRVNLNESWEVAYWAKKLGISEHQLIEIAAAVGPAVSDIADYAQFIGVAPVHSSTVGPPPFSQRGSSMANVFIEPAPDGHFIIEHENGATHTQHYPTQQAAIEHAKSMGYHPLVPRVRHLNDKKIPDHWRSAD